MHNHYIDKIVCRVHVHDKIIMHYRVIIKTLHTYNVIGITWVRWRYLSNLQSMLCCYLLLLFDCCWWWLFFFTYLLTLACSSSLFELLSALGTYKAGSITFGIGLISVPSSFSMRCRSNRSSYVIRLMAIPVEVLN